MGCVFSDPDDCHRDNYCYENADTICYVSNDNNESISLGSPKPTPVSIYSNHFSVTPPYQFSTPPIRPPCPVYNLNTPPWGIF